MKTQILRIGRKPDNDIIIDDPSVSSYHATVTLNSENSGILEDNDSSNGTFIDGMRIRKSPFTLRSNIVLGKSVFDTNKVFRYNKNADDFSSEFQELHKVWNLLEKERITLIQLQKNIDVLLAIPYVGRLVILIMSDHYNLEPRRVKLKEDMRRLWVCPNCKQPLRDYDWYTWNDCEHLQNCPKCKARWF